MHWFKIKIETASIQSKQQPMSEKAWTVLKKKGCSIVQTFHKAQKPANHRVTAAEKIIKQKFQKHKR